MVWSPKGFGFRRSTVSLAKGRGLNSEPSRGKKANHMNLEQQPGSAFVFLNIITVLKKTNSEAGKLNIAVHSGMQGVAGVQSAILFTLQMRLSYTMYSKMGLTAGNCSHLPTKASFPENSSSAPSLCPPPSSAHSLTLRPPLWGTISAQPPWLITQRLIP